MLYYVNMDDKLIGLILNDLYLWCKIGDIILYSEEYVVVCRCYCCVGGSCGSDIVFVDVGNGYYFNCKC